MGFFSKDISTMDDLFVHTLPAMIEKAANPELRSGLQQHLAETRNHVQRIEQVFEMHGVERDIVNSPAIDGIIEEADEIAGDVDNVDNKEVLDAALIAAAQAVEHYEITRYGALASWARQLGCSACASVLHRNLEEERAADQKLTQIAETKVNLEAAQ